MEEVLQETQALIFTVHIQACGLFHLPVSRPVIRSVFPSISVSFSSPPSLSRWLSEVLAESVQDEKKTKCLLIQQSYVTALSNSITLITPPKIHQPRGISQISRPPRAKTAVLMHRNKVWTDWTGKQQNDTTSLPRAFFPPQVLCSVSFFIFPKSSRTKSSKFSQQHVQLRVLRSSTYDLHAVLHQWQR